MLASLVGRVRGVFHNIAMVCRGEFVTLGEMEDHIDLHWGLDARTCLQDWHNREG